MRIFLHWSITHMPLGVSYSHNCYLFNYVAGRALKQRQCIGGLTGCAAMARRTIAPDWRHASPHPLIVGNELKYKTRLQLSGLQLFERALQVRGCGASWRALLGIIGRDNCTYSENNSQCIYSASILVVCAFYHYRIYK